MPKRFLVLDLATGTIDPAVLAAVEAAIASAAASNVVRITVADEAARYALTTAQVQNGDYVYQTDTGILYEVIDDTQLDNPAGYVALATVTAAQISDASAAGRALLTAASASAQRTELGLGSMALQGSGAVAITGGSITGLSNFSVVAAAGVSSVGTSTSITAGVGASNGAGAGWAGGSHAITGGAGGASQDALGAVGGAVSVIGGVGGNGTYIGNAASTGGVGGDVTVRGGHGGNGNSFTGSTPAIGGKGGSVLIDPGNGGTANDRNNMMSGRGGAAGDIIFGANGSGGTFTSAGTFNGTYVTGGSGGSFVISNTGGLGGAVTYTNVNEIHGGGVGRTVTLNASAGGAAGGGTINNGGNGGARTASSGVGGAATSTLGHSATAGAGGATTLAGAYGGSATGGGTNTAGAGGHLWLSGGAGGSASGGSNTHGAGGSIYLSAGAATSPALPGDIIIRSGTTEFARFLGYRTGTNSYALGLGTAAPTARLHVVGSTNTQQAIIKAHSSQSSPVLEIQNSSGTAVASTSHLGVSTAYSFRATVGGLTVPASPSSYGIHAEYTQTGLILDTTIATLSVNGHWLSIGNFNREARGLAHMPTSPGSTPYIGSADNTDSTATSVRGAYNANGTGSIVDYVKDAGGEFHGAALCEFDFGTSAYIFDRYGNKFLRFVGSAPCAISFELEIVATGVNGAGYGNQNVRSAAWWYRGMVNIDMNGTPTLSLTLVASMNTWSTPGLNDPSITFSDGLNIEVYHDNDQDYSIGYRMTGRYRVIQCFSYSGYPPPQ